MTELVHRGSERPDGQRAGDRPRLLIPDGRRDKDPIRKIVERPAKPDPRDPRML